MIFIFLKRQIMEKEVYNEIKVDDMTIGITGTVTGSTSNTGIGGDFTILDGTTITTSTFLITNTSEIETLNFEFKQTDDGNFIEVVKKQEPNPNITLAVWPPQNQVARIWKEIYGISEKNELVLIKTIEGDFTPGHYVEDDISFDE